MDRFTHLWNDLPQDERRRLHPYLIEAHILHLQQTRAKIVRGHKRTLAEIDGQINSLRRALPDSASAPKAPHKTPQKTYSGPVCRGSAARALVTDTKKGEKDA